MTKDHIRLMATAYFQILAVSCNVVFIQKQFIIGTLISSFAISFLWTLNVKRVAFGGWFDRFLYALFASLGSVSGFLLSNLISTWL